MTAPTDLTIRARLDSLSKQHARYVGAGKIAATIPRDDYESQGRPDEVLIVVPQITADADNPVTAG